MKTRLTYKDPLHVSYEELVVYYNGEPFAMMNKTLLDKQNAWGNLEAIKHCHWLKYLIFHIMAKTRDAAELYSLGLDITEIEYELQRLWGFELDANYHRSWEYPKCECPKVDNQDNYPHRKIISSGCPVHNPPITLVD